MSDFAKRLEEMQAKMAPARAVPRFPSTALDSRRGRCGAEIAPGRPCALLESHRGSHIASLSAEVVGDQDEEEVAAANAHYERQRREATWLGRPPARFSNAVIADVGEPEAAPIRAWLAVPKSERGSLVLTGTVGSGKTHTAVAVAREAHMGGAAVKVTSMAEMLLSLRERFNQRDGGATVGDYITPDVLVVDDLGTEKRSEWTEETLFAITDGRWRECRPMIVTTNLSPAQLRDHLGDRVYDRLRDGALAINMAGASRRRKSVAA